MRLLALMFFTSLSLTAYSLEFEAGSSGGMGGNTFIDNPPSDFFTINSMRICSGSVVDSIETTYKDVSGNTYSYGRKGGNGGSCSTLYFQSGEHIASVSGKYGNVIDSIVITTNYGRVLSKGGSGGKKAYKYTGNDQFTIAGFKGASANVMDSIGVIYYQTY